MTNSICPVCSAPATQQCSRCKNLKYCSPNCQRQDYGSHKLLCKTFPENGHPPDPRLRRCIYFPPDDFSPQWVWLNVKTFDVGGDEGFQHVDYTAQMGNDVNTICPGEKIPLNLRTMEPLEKHIYLAYDDMFLSKFAERNAVCHVGFLIIDGMCSADSHDQAIDAATKNKTGSEWRGPLVALCGRVNELYDIVEVKDMDMKDYSALVEFLRRHGGDLNTFGMWEAYRGLTDAATDTHEPEAEG